MQPILKLTTENRKKESLYASDYGRLEADIILGLKGIAPTEPTEWNDTLRMSAGKGVELQMIEVLKQSGLILADFDQDNEPRLEFERNGVPIHARLDGRLLKGVVIGKTIEGEKVEIITNEGEPIEIKSINNKNSFDIGSYEKQEPRENYVGQLAIYMDALNVERGHLFVSSIDGLHTFWFLCQKTGDGVYTCGHTVVNIKKEYERWQKIWEKFQKNEEPKWDEEIYKIPIAELDVSQYSQTAIKEARMGRKVLGSKNQYKITYSPYKSLIVANQGSQLGYNEQEIEALKEKTKGYSAK